MTDISYCDNTNCIYNKECICKSKDDIVLDENAVCSIAVYDKVDKSEHPPDEEKQKTNNDLEIFRKENEDWFKMI